MNTKSLKHHLATKVIGIDGIGVNKFDPLNNIEQAMGCAKAIQNTTFVVESCVVVWSDELPFRAAIRCTKRIQTLSVCDGNSESEALSLACAKATGWKDD